jgi:hypothetical protein
VKGYEKRCLLLEVLECGFEFGSQIPQFWSYNFSVFRYQNLPLPEKCVFLSTFHFSDIFYGCISKKIFFTLVEKVQCFELLHTLLNYAFLMSPLMLHILPIFWNLLIASVTNLSVTYGKPCKVYFCSCSLKINFCYIGFGTTLMSNIHGILCF